MDFHPLSLIVFNLFISTSLQHFQSTPGVPQDRGQDLHFQPNGEGLSQQVVHNAEHIKEHLKEVADKPTDQMTDEELEFHYFKLHDYDGNNKLDGLEIAKAFTHFHEDDHDEHKGASKREQKLYTDAELIYNIDQVMKQNDINDDGYIDYPEFVTVQRKYKEAVAQEEWREDTLKRQGQS